MSEKLTGRCLCGAVKYEIDGEAAAFYHCHCSRCRRLTGTGHASNLLMTPLESLTWTQGEELLKQYKVPEAERFYNNFCTECGSPMPRPTPQRGGVLVPAGSLEQEPSIQPSARIFWSSRSEWSCADDLPTYDGYP